MIASWKSTLIILPRIKYPLRKNYHLLHIYDLLDWLNGAKYFSQIDFKLGYYQICIIDEDYRNPNLGFMTKTRACEGAGQKWSLGVTFHAPGSVGKCEGMNLHIPKWVPTLGVGVLMDSQIFREWLWGSKPIELKSYLYHWKALGTYMSKMSLHDPFGYLKHKLWPKEGLRVKSPIWLSTTKN